MSIDETIGLARSEGFEPPTPQIRSSF